MIPFFLFFVTAACTFLLVRFWGGHGVASSGVQDIGFASAAFMLLAAYVSAFSLWAGRCIAALAVGLFGLYCLCENIGVFPRVINPWVLLLMLLMAVAAVYVFGSFRVTGTVSFFYPPHVSRFGKVVVWMFIAAPVALFCWWALWHDLTHVREVTVSAHWEPVTLEQVTSGRRQVKFTADDSSLSVTVASDNLYEELETAQKKSVDMVIRETYKHGSLVDWNVETIDGSGDFSLLVREPDSSKDSKWADLQVK